MNKVFLAGDWIGLIGQLAHASAVEAARKAARIAVP